MERALLRLLLVGEPEPWMRRDRDVWPAIASLARRNAVLVRTAEALTAAGVAPADPFPDLVDQERQRVTAAVGLIHDVAELCTAARIPFVFPKAFQHFPDMGHDIDLLVLSSKPMVDGLLRSSLQATRVRRTLTNVVAGKCSYWVPGSATPLELHRNRTGLVGEHPKLARRLVTRARQDDVAGTAAPIPKLEDQFLLQVVQRVYLHRSLRVGDILRGLTLLAGDLDWKEVVADAQELGIRRGLEHFVLHLDAWFRSVVGRPACPPQLTTLLPRSVDPRPRSFADPRETGKAYAALAGRSALGREWGSFGRLAVIPLLALPGVVRTVRRALPRNQSKPSRNGDHYEYIAP